MRAGRTGLGGDKVSLDRLRRLELAQPSGAYLGDEPVWRFHHVLIRDVAYRRLLKSDRADLHERLADWVEAGGASVAFDSDEMIARHLEAAHGYRRRAGHARRAHRWTRPPVGTLLLGVGPPRPRP